MVALRVGVDLQPGGRLEVVGPLEAAALLRRIAAGAYHLGASSVAVRYVDEQVTLARARHARVETLDAFPDELADFALRVAERGDASIRVTGSDPDLLSAVDPARVARITRSRARALRPASELSMRSFMPWTLIPYAVSAWARKVFPRLPAAAAQERLWDAIFAATRCDVEDPVGAWEAHLERLGAHARSLDALALDALHLRGPGTDLRVGLARGHVWEGGAVRCEVNGARAVSNIPTEEVFTTPHARRVDGTVRATKPLSHQGQLIEGFSLTFRDGVVTDLAAERGEHVLRALLDSDDGARRLGEVALVPHSSPISRSGLLFYDTLFDENAASHLALGRSYPTSIAGGLTRPREELARDGANDSIVHVDFMVGSAEVDVDGILVDGRVVPVMRRGEWTLA
jgi:aminopeptidase